jgi:hypothetical protein
MICFAAVAKIEKMGAENKCYSWHKKPKLVGNQNLFRYQENKAKGKNQ